MSDLENKKKKRVLIFSEYYLPGYKSGGGMRTIVNIIAALYDRFDFYVVTSDHDGRSDKTPYKNVRLNDWNQVENSQVYYLSRKNLRFSKILELYKTVKPDILYSNSYFSAFNVYLLLLNRLGSLKDATYMISPCGELSEGAMKVSLYKKKTFIFFAKTFNLHEKLVWKATHEAEKNEILELEVREDLIYIAPDITHLNAGVDFKVSEKPSKKKGAVKFVFLSRFSEKKNFKYFIDNLSGTRGDILVDIYGPVDDPDYWNECAAAIEKLPANIKIELKGPVPHSDVHRTLLKYHFFVMPTLGENFGHAFLEALSAGCPLVISDRTPWRELAEKKIGWDIPLEDKDGWKAVIKRCVEMDQTEYSDWSDSSNSFAGSWLAGNDFVEATCRLLQSI